MLAAIRIFSPSELQNGAIDGETVLGPTALIVNRRQGAADRPTEGYASLEISHHRMLTDDFREGV